MKIAQKYSHLNGEEYLVVHHKKLYKEITRVIESIDADEFLTKESREKTMTGKMLYSPIELNEAFKQKFNNMGWCESRYQYYITTERELLPELLLFYSGGMINLGIEVLPTKKMQSRMSSGVAYYEGEVYNVLRHGRNNPPVPLLILGIEP